MYNMYITKRYLQLFPGNVEKNILCICVKMVFTRMREELIVNVNL